MLVARNEKVQMPFIEMSFKGKKSLEWTTKHYILPFFSSIVLKDVG